MNLSDFVTPELRELRAAFQAKNLDIRFVGGCVRDSMMGKECKDVDFATDATPEEQEEIYFALKLRRIPTGLQHGTWTVILNDVPYEITTLRTEAEHDGRWAKMTWTRDWTEDLSRRDLTINAMALTFDGKLIDPFGGYTDLVEKRVRFVGNAVERIQEDYLRILRFFRFHARIAGTAPFDEEAVAAIKEHGNGLKNISRERVWSEVSRILHGPHGDFIFICLIGMVGFAIDAPHGDLLAFVAARKNTDDPVTCLAALVRDGDEMKKLAENWKWSADERDQGIFVANSLFFPPKLETAKHDICVLGHNKDWWVQTFLANGQLDDAAELRAWVAPVFPIQGRDLLALGWKPGPQIGDTLRKLLALWAAQDFQIDKDAVLKELATT